MSRNRALPLFIALALAVTAVFSFVGLPFDQFGWMQVEAQYVPPCASRNQIRIYAPTPLYNSQSLSQVVFVAENISNKNRQKFLLCDANSTGPALQIWYAGSLLWVNNRPPTFDIVPRYFRDNQ
jgi:hypothetical protein